MKPMFEVDRVSDRAYAMTLHGDVYFESLADSRLAAAREAIPRGSEVTVDLTDVRFLDSSGIGLLVALRNEAESFRATGASPAVLRTLSLTGLIDMVPEKERPALPPG